MEDATPTVISTSSTRTMETSKDELKPANPPTWRAKCRGVVNHSRVAECTRLSPEREYSGVS